MSRKPHPHNHRRAEAVKELSECDYDDKEYLDVLSGLSQELTTVKRDLSPWISARSKWCEAVCHDGTRVWYKNTAGALLNAVAVSISENASTR